MKILFYFKLALKNTVKYKNRNIQVVFITALGALVLSFLGGFIVGLFEKYVNNILKETDHAKIYRKGYYAKQEISSFELLIKNYHDVIREIKSIEPTLKITPVIKSAVSIVKDEESINIYCIGIQPYAEETQEEFPSFKSYSRKIVSGSYFNSNRDKGIIISSYTAQQLNYKVGDNLILFSSDKYGSFNAVELPIIGIFKTGYKDKDEQTCLVDIESMKKLLGLDETEITELSLIFDDFNKAEMFKNKINNILGKYELEYFSWKELLGLLVLSIKYGKIFYLIIYLIFLIIAVVGITNTVLISLLDRIRDVGTFLSLGFSRADINKMILSEMLILGFIGATIGILAGSGLLYYYSIYGFPISDASQELLVNLFVSENRIYISFKLEYLILPFLASLFVPTLSAIYPLLVIRKITIRQALGYV